MPRAKFGLELLLGRVAVLVVALLEALVVRLLGLGGMLVLELLGRGVPGGPVDSPSWAMSHASVFAGRSDRSTQGGATSGGGRAHEALRCAPTRSCAGTSRAPACTPGPSSRVASAAVVAMAVQQRAHHLAAERRLAAAHAEHALDHRPRRPAPPRVAGS